MENKFWKSVLQESLCRSSAVTDWSTQALQSDIPRVKFKFECVWPLARYLIPLNFSFLIGKMAVIIPTSQGSAEQTINDQ